MTIFHFQISVPNGTLSLFLCSIIDARYQNNVSKKIRKKKNDDLTLFNGQKIFDLATEKKMTISTEKKNDNMATYCHFFFFVRLEILIFFFVRGVKLSLFLPLR